MGNLLIISCFKFLVSMVTHFWSKCSKCCKMGQKCQIFTCSRSLNNLFSHLKCNKKLKQIPRNGVNQCVKIALNDL